MKNSRNVDGTLLSDSELKFQNLDFWIPSFGRYEENLRCKIAIVIVNIQDCAIIRFETRDTGQKTQKTKHRNTET